MFLPDFKACSLLLKWFLSDFVAESTSSCLIKSQRRNTKLEFDEKIKSLLNVQLLKEQCVHNFFFKNRKKSNIFERWSDRVS